MSANRIGFLDAIRICGLFRCNEEYSTLSKTKEHKDIHVMMFAQIA